MSMRVSSAALYITPVAPVVRVRARTADETTPVREASLPVASEGTMRWSDDLRRQRSEALAELQGALPAKSSVNPLRQLDREQLAAMVYDRDDRFPREQRRAALAVLESNDREFMERARDMTRASGDDRVLLAALIDLEDAKSAIERAVPEGEPARDVAALRHDLAARTADLGGAPASLSLRYPNGLTPPPREPVVSAASPGATRVAQAYRDETLF